MTTTYRKIFAVLLAVVLVIGTAPVTLAGEAYTPEDIPTQEDLYEDGYIGPPVIAFTSIDTGLPVDIDIYADPPHTEDTDVTESNLPSSSVTITASITFVAPEGFVPSYIFIPDPNFSTAVRAQLGLAFGASIPRESVEEITALNLSGLEIASLAGIEYFTALEQLFVQDNQLTTIDISQNLALVLLDIRRNNIQDLYDVVGWQSNPNLILDSTFQFLPQLDDPEAPPSIEDDLATAIADAESHLEYNYTTECWSRMQEALTAAIAVRDDESATQDDIQAALNTLKSAINNLVSAVDPPPALPEIDEYELIYDIPKTRDQDHTDYVAPSWVQIALE